MLKKKEILKAGSKSWIRMVALGITFFALGVAKGSNVPVKASNEPSSTGFRGVNWADKDDNYSSGVLEVSGLSTYDNYATVQAKADIILSGFINKLGANTVRLPINPATVSSDYWSSYCGAINKAVSLDMKVILACWDSNTSQDGKIDNMTDFWNMWTTVIKKYGSNANVYFEVMNEPFGYSQTDWENICASFLSRYSTVPHGRILIGGTGYDDNVTGMGADSRFNDCLLSQHIYGFWATGKITEAEWIKDISNRVGNYASRTVITEFGADMTTGLDYNTIASKDYRVAFYRGLCTYIHNNNMGCCAWPGLRTGDTYSLTSLYGSGANITMSVNNTSAVDVLKYAYNHSITSGACFKILNKNSALALEVSGTSTAKGANVDQYAWNETGNQIWQVNSVESNYYKIINKNSGLALDVNDCSIDDSANVNQYTFNGGSNQLWQIIDMNNGYYKIINKNSGKALDVYGCSTANGGNVVQYSYNGGDNQLWKLVIQ